MDLTDLPFGKPIILRSSEMVLHSEFGSRRAVSAFDRSDEFVWLELERTEEGNVALRAVRSDRYLVVHRDGDCFFEATTIAKAEAFMVPLTTGGLILTSCRTEKFLIIDGSGRVRCDSRCTNAGWEIVAPIVSFEPQTVINHLNQIEGLLERVVSHIERYV